MGLNPAGGTLHSFLPLFTTYNSKDHCSTVVLFGGLQKYTTYKINIPRVMKEMKVTELPPLVYQLLVLSVKGQRSLVMNGVRALFNQINQEVLSASDMDTEDR